jgi:iron complex outermembrane receptor protein
VGDVDTKTWALFADVTMDLADLFGFAGPGMEALELSVGGRYTEDERTSRIVRDLFVGTTETTSAFGGNAESAFALTSTDDTYEAAFDDFTPRVSLSWQPSFAHTLYVSYSEGFKGGSFDPRGSAAATPDFDNDGTVTRAEQVEFLRFEPETITTWEAGWKAAMFDGRFTSSLAVFVSDYTDVQIPGSVGVDLDNDGVPDNFAGVTTNAGSADFWGFEWEANAALAEDLFTGGDFLNVNWAIGHIDAEFQEFIVAVTDPVTGETGFENVADQRNIQNTPPWTAHVGLDLSIPAALFDRDGYVSLLPRLSYRGDTSQFEIPSPIDQEAYTLFDASLVWASTDGRINFGVHGRNLTDERYIVAGYDFVTATQLGLTGVLTAFYGDPRTVTGTIGIRF